MGISFSSIKLLHPLTEWNYKEKVDFTILLILFIYILFFFVSIFVRNDPIFRNFVYFEWFVILFIVCVCIFYIRYNKIELNTQKYMTTVFAVLFIAVIVLNFVVNLKNTVGGMNKAIGDFFKERTHTDTSLITPILYDLLKRNLIFFVCALLAAFILYYASRDHLALTNIGYLYLFAISVLLLFGYYLTPNDVREQEGDSTKFLYKLLSVVSGSIIVAMLFYAFLLYLSNPYSDTLNMIFAIILGFMIIIALAIIYYFFGDYFKKLTGIMGFIIQFIFYIPCMFSEFIKYIKNQMKITPSVVFILFIIEILLIIIYFYLPKLVNSQINKKSIVLLKSPVFLDTKNNISTNEMFIMKDAEIDKIKEKEKENNYNHRMNMIASPYINSNYAFSFWVYINSTKTGVNSDNPDDPDGSSNPNFAHEIDIFNYGGGKPRVAYVNDKKNNNYFNVYFTNTDESEENRLRVTIPLQKWTYFVFNYLNNSADLFIDGNLEKTFSFNEDNIPLDGNKSDNVSVGNDNGINGAICNVMFYTAPLTENQIVTNYNMLVLSNPPIQ